MPVVHSDAGHLPALEKLENIPALMSAYYTEFPNPTLAAQRVSFGTSGHRGTSVLCSFNEEHIYAITQAVCDYRAAKGIDGPLFLGGDTHALQATPQVGLLRLAVLQLAPGDGAQLHLDQLARHQGFGALGGVDVLHHAANARDAAIFNDGFAQRAHPDQAAIGAHDLNLHYFTWECPLHKCNFFI